MCEELPRMQPYASQMQQLSPESELQGLIQRELKVYVGSEVLRLFLRYHWKEVARLAHKIHEG